MSELYAIDKSTLDNIGNAIREKKATSESIPVTSLAAEILSISEGSFAKNKLSKIIDGSITELTAKDLAGVTQISAGVFYGDKSLTKVTIPDNIEAINILAFYGCYALKELTLGNNLKMIGSSAFSNCTTLPNVSIPDSVETIGSNAFHTCITFTEIKIPDSVTEIGEYAFTDCTNLKKVELSKNIKRINQGTFWNCSSLNNLVIPEGVTHIDYSGIRHCTSLTDITLPNSLVEIGSFAFYDSDGLKQISIPQNVTKIGEYAFYDCNNLLEVVTGGNLSYVDKGAFQWCNKLQRVTVGENVKEIGEYALADCSGLREVMVFAKTPPTLSWTTCYGASEDFAIYVPPESLEAYKNAEVWSYKAAYIHALGSKDCTIQKGTYSFHNALGKYHVFNTETIEISGVIQNVSLSQIPSSYEDVIGRVFTRIRIEGFGPEEDALEIRFFFEEDDENDGYDTGDIFFTLASMEFEPSKGNQIIIRLDNDAQVNHAQMFAFNEIFSKT